MTHESPQKTSQIIEELIKEFAEDGYITVLEFLEKLGNRAQAIAILVFSISAVVAGIVPGFSTITALPILLIALQMAVGMKSVWLPKKLREKQIPPRVVSGALSKSIPSLKQVERFLRPRFSILTGVYVQRFMALIIVVLACILALPIPGGNFLPSFGITILALAMLERDGLFVLIALGLVMLTGGVMIDLLTQAIHYTQMVLDDFF